VPPSASQFIPVPPKPLPSQCLPASQFIPVPPKPLPSQCLPVPPSSSVTSGDP
ncbi:uncharacterized protein LOC128899828, partial [Dryobates pubescens]|uniref:uncharacterized protein LOC128899828 n=1 Tax=Dryobates pubescens TaxID=118200 RepID=UPI0023B94B15